MSAKAFARSVLVGKVTCRCDPSCCFGQWKVQVLEGEHVRKTECHDDETAAWVQGAAMAFVLGWQPGSYHLGSIDER